MSANRSEPSRSLPARIFLSPSEPRLRAGWRLLIQTILLVVLSILVGIFLFPLAFLGIDITGDMLWLQLFQIVAVTLSVFLARRLLDRRSIRSLGLEVDRRALLDLLAGFAITFLMMGSIFLFELGMGWLSFEGFAWQVDGTMLVLTEVLLALFTFVLVGWSEELLSRGYHLQTLASGLNLFWGVLLSSAVFGVLHLGNPNNEAKLMIAAGITLAGVFLAYGYLATRQLWLPIGLHIGWNFFEGVGFGFPVSGMQTYALTRVSITGPEMLTGGAFGPEAGLVLLPGLAVGTLLVFAYVKHLRARMPA